LFRRRGVRETRAVALARVSDERELAHYQCGPGRVEQALGELAVLVLEDPQLRHLLREPLHVAGLVLALDPEQYEQTRADRALPL